MKIISLGVALLLVMGSVSCQSNGTGGGGGAGAGKGTQPGNIEHVVLVWMKTPVDQEARRKIIEVTKTFKQIPGVIDARAGKGVPSTQPAVDSSYDVGIVVTFKDRESLKNYGPHPIHEKAARELIVPVIRQLKAYDIELE